MANNVKVTIEGENKTKAAFGDVTKSMGGLQSAAGNLQTKALLPLQNVLGTGLKTAAVTAVAAIAGLTAAVGSGVKAAMGMEQQIADIASVMGIAKDATQPLKDLIQNLGLDPKLKVSATEAADAVEMLGRNGLAMTDIMNGAARGTVLLANATNADFGVAANIATDAMAMFNIEAKDMKRAVDGIAGVTVNSKLGIDDYALALANGGKGAVAAGISFDQFNEMLVATASNFTGGQMAGTALTNMLLNLSPKTDVAADAMKALGIITEDGRNRFFDLNGEVVDNAELSRILTQTLGGLTTQQRLSAVDTLFGRDALGAINGMIANTDDSWQHYSKALSENDAEVQAATRMDTLSGAMEILWGVIDTLKLQIGDVFLPMLRRMAEMFSEQATVQGPKLVEAFQKLAAQLTVSLDKFLPWIEQAIPKMIEQIPSIVTGLINFGREALNVATQIYNAVAPVVKFVAGLTDLKGILTAVGVLMAVSAVAQVVTFVAGIVSAVGAVVGFVGSLGAAGAAFAAVVAAIGPVIAIVAAVGAAIYGLKVAWDNNLFGIRDVAKQVFDWLKNAFSNLPQTLGDAKEAFYNWATGAMQRMREGFQAGKDWARNALDVALDYIKGANFGSMGQNFYDSAKGIMSKVGEGFGAARDFAKGQLTQVLTDVQNQGVAFAAGAFAGRMYDSAKDAMRKFAEGLGTSNLGNDVRNVLNGVINVVNEWSGGAGSHLYTKGRDVIWKMLEGLRSINVGADLWQNLNGIINTVNEWSNNAQNHLYIKASEIGRRLMEGLRDGIQNMFGSVINKMSEVTNLLPQWLRDRLGIHSPSTVFMEIGTNIMAGLAQGLNEAMAMPQVAMTQAANSLTNISSNVNSNNQTVYNVNQQVTGGDGYDNLSMMSMLFTGA